MKRILAVLALSVIGAAIAKIPPPVLDDAGKAKAAETAARAAWQGKVDALQLCRAQDRVAAYYQKTAGKPGTSLKADAANASASATPTTAKAAAVASAPAAAAAIVVPASTPATASTAASTVTTIAATAALPITPCSDPGPFAYNPPSQTPLETSGAHSPAGTATKPPSVKQESSQIAPAKK